MKRTITITETNPIEQYIKIGDIVKSGMNPRTNFNREALESLAENIRENGLLQSVTVRPLGDKYELVCGERRVRACEIAGISEIRAFVRDMTDEQAKEAALIENLQRADINPIEEARAFKELTDTGRHTAETLARQYGKSEKYVRMRLKLNNLIPSVSAMLIAGEIPFSTAFEVSQYAHGIQKDIYKNHLKSAERQSWRNYKPEELRRAIEQAYTTDLAWYAFDKSECRSCTDNTNNQMLFACPGTCGNCTNRKCLEAKNSAYLTETVSAKLQAHPLMEVAESPYNANADVSERFKMLGHRVTDESTNYIAGEPKQPEPEEYRSETAYRKAMKNYRGEVRRIKGELKSYMERAKAGELTVCAVIGDKGITYGYRPKKKEEPVNPAEKYRAQDRRNAEIKDENIIDRAKSIYRETEMKRRYSHDEESLFYYCAFAALPYNVKTPILAELGAESAEDAFPRFEKPDEALKVRVRRAVVEANLNLLYARSAPAGLLLNVVRYHAPKDILQAEQKYGQVYDKRRARIAEKLSALGEGFEEEKPETAAVAEAA